MLEAWRGVAGSWRAALESVLCVILTQPCRWRTRGHFLSAPKSLERIVNGIPEILAYIPSFSKATVHWYPRLVGESAERKTMAGAVCRGLSEQKAAFGSQQKPAGGLWMPAFLL